MRLPNFLIIGAAKSGTTALYRQLLRHPDIFMSPNKEPGFFAFQGHDLQFKGPGDMGAIGQCAVNNFETYAALFQGSENALAVGEASNIYLYHPQAPAAVRDQLPEVKLIALLRNPIERAFSAYMMLLRDGRESLPFHEAVQRSTKRVEAGWSFLWDLLGCGLYAKQLNRYFTVFPKDQVLTLFYDDYLKRPNDVLNQIGTFLGVKTWTYPMLKSNISRDPDRWPFVRSQRVGRFVNRDSALRNVARAAVPTTIRRGTARVIRRLNMRIPELAEHTRRELVDFYRDDVAELERLTGRDLSRWVD